MNEIMDATAGITAIIVNYKTADLTRRAVESFLHWYPNTRLVLIDNGSRDSSTGYIARMARRFENVTCILNQANRYHGPAMDQGIRSAATRHIFTLDSDCCVQKGGFLEEMIELFDDPGLYATGRRVYMDRFGFEKEFRAGKKLIPYVCPYAMMLDRKKYLRMSVFFHHGSPCLENMRDAQRQGYRVSSFAIERFVFHQGRGTCSRYGYGLGPRTLIESLLSRIDLFSTF